MCSSEQHPNHKVKTHDVFWVGKITVCQLCNGKFHNGIMYDKSIGGTWGNICDGCFRMETDRLLGIGYGQKYHLLNGKWKLVEGNI